MKPTNFLNRKPSRRIAIVAIFAILAPTAGPAQSRHSAPEAVRSHVLKLGVGQWVRVREQSGVNLKGQITSIGPRLFQIQQRDAAGPTDVYYADVARIRSGAPSEPFRGPNGESAAGMIVAAVVLTGVFIGIVVCGEGGCNNSNKPTQATH
jgi:hypothetical protein